MTFTAKAILAALVALMIAVASTLAITSALNTAYQSGMTDGVRAMNAARDAEHSGDVIHGSPSYSGAGDVHTMNPYDHTICDRSANFREASGLSYTAGAQDVRAVFDNNGAGGGCNHNNLPFRGALHQACSNRDFGGCADLHSH